MPERKSSAIIEDILECIEHIQSYTAELSFEQFSSHFMTVEACLYNIQIIGEAVSLLPQDIKKENPGIPWAAIKGMRNRLIHEYFGTDLQLVWGVIKDQLPGLNTDLQRLFSELVGQNR
ncbi:MAG TPA: DUF86 domain-containing protein [Chitinophagaceae bacterium]|nr:DUF86 domain-containing protein [Chitinophagaceae bacterium]